MNHVRAGSKGVSSITKLVSRGILALAAGVVLSPMSARATDFFDWGAGAAPQNTAYTPVILVNDNNLAQAQAALTASQAAGHVLAIKIDAGTTLSQNTINTLFNNYQIKYVFADFEGTYPGHDPVSDTTTLVSRINANPNGSARLAAGTTFVGNYGLAPIPGQDPTAPNSGTTYSSGNALVPPTSGNTYTNSADFHNTGVNMATESVYPGDGSFRNPVSNNSTAPNIRSALFSLPIQRVSIVSQNLGQGQVNIPYISRFNNFANASLSNGTVPRTDNIGTQPAFNTSGAAINGHAVLHQLLSRDDFQALTLHYRMRGASSYQLLDPGVQGYTVAQYEADAQSGWNDTQSGGLVTAVLAGTSGRVATLPTAITFNGTKQTIEQAGVVWSAVTNDAAQGGGSAQLAILISNMSETNGPVTFGTRINGATLNYTTGVLAAGSHTILRFTKSGAFWMTPQAVPAFNDVALASRDGIGVPEPTSVSLIALGAIGILARRRRRSV